MSFLAYYWKGSSSQNDSAAVAAAVKEKQKMKQELDAAYASGVLLPKKAPSYTDTLVRADYTTIADGVDCVQVYDAELARKQKMKRQKKAKKFAHGGGGGGGGMILDTGKIVTTQADGAETTEDSDGDEDDSSPEPQVASVLRTRKNKKSRVVPVAIQVNVPSAQAPPRGTSDNEHGKRYEDKADSTGSGRGGGVTVIDRATTQYGIYVNRSGLRECVICRDYIMAPHLTTIKEKDLPFVYCSAGCKHTIWHKSCALKKIHAEGLPELRWVCEMCKQPTFSERIGRFWTFKGAKDTFKRMCWAFILFMAIMISAGYGTKVVMYLYALDAYNARAATAAAAHNDTEPPFPAMWSYQFECKTHEQKLVQIKLPDGGFGFVMSQGAMQLVGTSYGLWPDRCHFVLAGWPVVPAAIVLVGLWLIWHFAGESLRRVLYSIRHKQAEFTN